MKYLITYFYNVRFLKKNMIPFSTAKWDPDWFHNGTSDYSYCFFDKRSVCNGLRLNFLSPDNTDCHGKPCESKPESCMFLKKYLEQLEKINFKLFTSYCEEIANDIKAKLKFEEDPIVVLLVYEKPDNPCSERTMLKKWFEENGKTLEEFNKEEN